jgi:hypothetical protein
MDPKAGGESLGSLIIFTGAAEVAKMSSALHLARTVTCLLCSRRC